MKEKIRAYTGYNEYKRIHYYKDFEIIEELPKVGDKDYDKLGDQVIAVNPVSLDCEQGNDDVYNYDYYEIVTKYKNDDGEDEEESYFVAVEIDFEKILKEQEEE